MLDNNLKNRIEKGIKFFRQLESRQDKALFQKYWRSFLLLVEQYLAEPVKETVEETFESAKNIFKEDVKEE